MGFERKKRILFILRNFEHGGIPRALANLLDRLDISRVSVDVFPVDPAGMFRDSMNNCRILPGNFLLRLLTCNYRVEDFPVKLLAIIVKLIRYAFMRCLRYDMLSSTERHVARTLDSQYDAVWACSEESPARIAQVIKCNRRVLWLHNRCDTERVKWCVQESNLNYLAFDKLVCVAEHVMHSLTQNLRNLFGLDVVSRTCVMRNIVNQEDILEMGKVVLDDSRFMNDCFTIVNVGRLAWEKRLEVIPEIVAKFKNSGMNLRWYLIGDGAPIMWSILKEQIAKWDVGNDVILLGVKKNPYSYIANADVLALTSREEAYPTVVNEALVLGTYVIAVDINGMDEIVPSDRGCIAPIEDIPQKILDLYSQKRKSGSIKMSGMDFTAHNARVMSEFYRMIEE